MKKSYLGVLLIVLSSFGFGIMPIFALSAYKSNITVPTLLSLRFLMASIIFFGYVLFKKYRLNHGVKGILSLFILGGICYTLQSSLYFTAVKYIPASLAVMILYTSPVIIAILSYFVDKERLTLRTIISALVSIGGIVLINKGEPGNVSVYGVMLASGAALVYSFYIVFSNRVVKQIQPVVTSAYVTLFTAVSLFITGFATGNINYSFSASAWLPLLGLVIFSTVLAIFTLFWGLEILGSTKASILGMLEPVFTVVLSIIILEEALTFIKVLGSIMIMGSAILIITANKQDNTDAAIIID